MAFLSTPTATLLGAALLLAGPSAMAQPDATPRQVELNGQSLAATSCGVRDTFWIDHFSATLYVARDADPARALLDADEPKALRLDIINPSWLPDRQPEEWRTAFRENLTPRRFEQLQSLYQGLAPGDAVLAAYRPGTGMSLEVNGRLVLREPGHSLLDDLLRAWSGSTAPLDKLRPLLARHPC